MDNESTTGLKKHQKHPFISSAKDSNLVERLHNLSDNLPNKVAFRFIQSDTKYSEINFRELLQKATSISNYLQEKRLHSKTALLMFHSEEEFVLGFLACLLSGTIAIPVPPVDNIRIKNSLPRLKAIIKDANAQAILCDSPIKSAIENPNYFDEFSSLKLIETPLHKITLSPVNIVHSPRPNDVAYLQYTSGSTSSPKGVMISHQNIISNSRYLRDHWGINDESISASWLPYFHDYGLVYGFIQSIFSGITTVIMAPTYFIRNPMRWLIAISENKVTHSGGPNFAFQACIDKFKPEKAKNMDLSTWVCAHNGAEPIHEDTLKDFFIIYKDYGFKWETFFPSYGMAETTLMIATKEIGNSPTILSVDREQYEQGQISPTNDLSKSTTVIGCGSPVGRYELKIVDPITHKNLPPNMVGEIWVNDNSVARGYWENPEETQSIFAAKIKDNHSQNFLRTGDLGFVDDKGELFITSRLKDLIIIHGRNFYPNDVEQDVGKSHSAIKSHEVVAFSVTKGKEERLIIVAELKKSETNKVRFDNVIQQIRQSITENHEIDAHEIILVKSGTVPKTSSGKVQRQKCKSQYLEGTLSTLRQEVTVAMEEPEILSEITSTWELVVAEIWANHLNIPIKDITPESNFFYLSGDSLKALQIASELSEKINDEIENQFVYAYPTLKKQADYLESRVISTSQISFVVEDVIQEHTTAPLTPLQQSFFINRRFGDTGCYAFADISLQGPISKQIIQTAFKILISRNPALSLSFDMTNEPTQKKSPNNSFKITFEDLSVIPKKDQLNVIQTLSENLINKEFDLTKSPLMHVSLLRLSATEYRLLLNVDHLVVDGFSLGLLLDDLHHIISVLISNSDISNSPETTHSFLSILHSQARRINEKKRAYDLAYWTSYLDSWEPFPELPFKKELKVGENNNQFSTFDTPVDQNLIKELTKLSQENHITLFSLLFASFLKLLHHWTQSDTLFINTPVLNRNHNSSDIQKIIGCFTDILPVRGEKLIESSPLKIAKVLHSDIAKLHEHHSISGVELARKQFKDSSDISALSPIIFSSALLNIQHHQKDGFSQTLNGIRTGAPQTWLDVVVLDNGINLTLSWNYRKCQFEHHFIETLAKQYLTYLNSLVKGQIDSFSILSPCDLDAFKRLNNTARSYGQPKLLHQRVTEQSLISAQKLAVTYKSKILTYAELDEKSDIVAGVLQSKGVKVGDFVPVILERSDNFIVSILGVLKAGGAYVPIDPEYPVERQSYMIENSNSSIVIASKKSSIPLVDSVTMIDINSALRRKPSLFSAPEINLESPAYMIYTSGSTGNPKGVVISHQAIDNRLRWMQSQFSINSNDIIAQRTSQSFDVSVWELFLPIQEGSLMHIIPNNEVKDPQKLFQHLVENKVTITHFVPSLFQAFIQFLEALPSGKTSSLQSLRWIITSGEALNVSSVKKWQSLARKTPIANLYGPTEATVDVTYHLLQKPLDNNSTDIPIGTPVANTQIFVLDSNSNLCPVGIKGELCISGVQLANGYFNNPKLTNAVFKEITDPLNDTQTVRVYKTGDKACLSEDGTILFFGRFDFQVKIRGYRIECGEIEAALESIQGIAKALVVPEKLGKSTAIIAYYTTKGGNPINDKRIISKLQKNLPKYMVPSIFIHLSQFQTTSNGKVDRKSLPDPKKHIDSKKVVSPPSTKLQKQLLSIWKDVLGDHSGVLDINDSFFESGGGDSISVIHMLAKVHRQFDVQIPVQQFLRTPTLNTLAVFIKSSGSKAIECTSDFFKKESILSKEIFPQTSFEVSTFLHRKTVFLTGATGYLGSQILHQLLLKGFHVYCLVRAESSKKALERILSTCQKFHLPLPDKKQITIVLGDLSKPNFSLSKTNFKALSANVDLVIHNAAVVNFIYSYHDLKKVNVDATQEMIRFCCETNTIPLAYISTIGVFESPTFSPNTFIKDDTLPGDPEKALLGYHQTKCISERLIKQANERGIPSCVLRPSLISGSQKRLRFNDSDFLYKMIVGIFQFGKAPDLDYKLNILPANFVADSIINISTNISSYGQAVNIVNSQPTQWKDILDWGRANGFSIDEMPYNKWIETLESDCPKDNPLFSLIPNLKAKVFDDLTLLEALKHQNISFNVKNLFSYSDAKTTPEMSLELFSKYIHHFIETGALKAKQTVNT